jgi:hypothetical protein
LLDSVSAQRMFVIRHVDSWINKWRNTGISKQISICLSFLSCKMSRVGESNKIKGS